MRASVAVSSGSPDPVRQVAVTGVVVVMLAPERSAHRDPAALRIDTRCPTVARTVENTWDV
ncbi:hypothetical protein GCM10022273_14540 [Cellulomonas soli]